MTVNTVYRYFFRLMSLLVVVGLVGCSTGGMSGAFGTSAPSKRFEPLSEVATLQQARIASGASTSPRVLADMRELAKYQGNIIYKIGASDLLGIKVFRADELSGEVRVSQQGTITLPLLGSVRLAGLTQVQAEQRLAQLLGANLLQNPQVSVFIKEYTNQRVTIEGAVRSQGVFPLNGKVTVLQAIALAGGLSEDAKTDTVALFRKQGGRSSIYYMDLDLIRNGQASDPFVLNDDRIVIQKKEKQRVTVEGEVKSPGVFSFEEQTTVLQAIALSKGLTELGAPDRVILFRRDGGSENAYGVNLSAIRQGSSPDPYVQSGDRIVVHRSNSRYWLGQAASLLSPLRLLSGF